MSNVGGVGCHVTYAGLKAVLNFAYNGEVNMNFTEARNPEEVLTACRCLGVERFAEVCKAEVPSTGRAEKEEPAGDQDTVGETCWLWCYHGGR